MNAVGRLGSYISKSVYTVSTPFHPFGGAVDIIVVEQQDGSFKSSPWYVRFGKFQGVLKAKEKVVKICVNGVEMGFHMYLENDGQACFLREVDAGEGDDTSCPPSWGDDTDVLSNTRLSVKSKSCDFVGMEPISATKIDMGNVNVVVRTKSRRSGILGYVFGRKATKEDGVSEVDEKGSGVRDGSLEHAEIAADLLEVKWSTNCHSPKCIKDNAPQLSPQDASKDSNLEDSLKNDDEKSALVDDKSADSSLSSPQSLENTETSAVADSIGGISSDINSKLSTCFPDQERLESDVTSSNTIADTEAYSPPVCLHPSLSVDLESQAIFSISSISNSTCKTHSTKDGKTSPYQGPPEPNGVFSLHSTVTSVSSEEEEQLLFGDLEDLSANNGKNQLHVPSDYEEENEAYDCLASSGTKEAGDSHIPHEDNKPLVAYRSKLTTVGSNVTIPVKPDKAERMAISLPNMWSHDNHLPSQHGEHVPCEILQKSEDASISQELNDGPDEPETDKTFTGNVSPPIDGSGETQRTWSFPFKRARSADLAIDNGNTGAESLMKDTGGSTGEVLPKVTKKIKRALTPTSEQLASLNLKEGKNEVVFTFSTPMLGEQKVDAQIYLWKWDMRIVISDVDGTITRSDVLGQFMPLVGVDWSQTGVVHLFSAIKENGYQMLFLSARSISQAYITRQFLVNLMQDGKGMPEGPVIISPDGLFPSLFREVVRRAPHEFKIACLEDIKALFPSDRNPFYAGFGNRDTDEISYLKVGIPKGKIFIINPKGEIVVNRHITNTKSYTSLHVLVNGVFPDFSTSEQEDFNSWNFWKLPPPTMH